MTPCSSTFLRSAALLTIFPVATLAQRQPAAPNPNAYDVKANYDKHEYRIVTRDGIKLFTSVYTPKDTTRRYPILLDRTPYSVAPYGEAEYKTSIGPNEKLARDGYIVVYQDVRGRFMSEGTYAFMTPHIDKKNGPKDVDESSDTYDTIEWLLEHIPHNNGKVGIWGISAPGFFTAAGMIDAHPALKAASPQAPLIDWYMGDDRHHNGALTLAQTFNFLNGFDRPRNGPTTTYPPRFDPKTPDGYNFFLAMGPVSNANTRFFKDSVPFWNTIMQHPNYDAYWQKRSLQHHLKDIKPAVLHVGGWYDAEDPYGPLEANRAMDTLSPQSTSTIVMGPWSHGAWSRVEGESFGPIHFGSATGVFFRDSLETPFFDCYLKDRCGEKLPKAVVFQTGVNQWRRFDAWPPKQAQKRAIYLDANGALSWTPPAGRNGVDTYVSDPKKPVPYTTATSFGYYREYTIEDQRFAASRPDVLVYQTPVLTEDLTLAGPMRVSLKVATSGTDSDFIVKVIDVYPEDMPDNGPNPTGVKLAGYQQLLRGDVMRARWRKSFSKPEAMIPNRPETVEWTLQDVFHTIKKGHRLMVQVQSSWFPLIDRNPQTFVDINTAKASDFKTATQRVYHSRALPSQITLSILPDVRP